MDRRIKNKGVYDQLGMHLHDQNWADRDEEKEYVWQGPMRSDKEPEEKSSASEEQ
jgi:hypothetical protein